MATHIAQLLEKFTTLPATQDPKFYHTKLLMQWSQIMGKVAEQARLERVYGQTLVLGVYDTAWMQELHWLSELLLEKVNQAIGKHYFTAIRLRYVNKLPAKPSNDAKALTPPSTIITPPIIIHKRELLTLNNISDPELRSALRNFLIRCRQTQHQFLPPAAGRK